MSLTASLCLIQKKSVEADRKRALVLFPFVFLNYLTANDVLGGNLFNLTRSWVCD